MTWEKLSNFKLETNKFSSIITIINVIINTENSFIFALNLYLSSRTPKKKNENEPKINENSSLFVWKNLFHVLTGHGKNERS